MKPMGSFKLGVGLAILLLAAMASTALAAGMSVSPSSGGQDTSFEFRAEGFNPGETVSLWLTLPNLLAVGQGQQLAAHDGSIEFSLQADASWQTGEYIAVAHGLQSGREYFCKFTVYASAPVEADENATESNGEDTGEVLQQDTPNAHYDPGVTMYFLGDPGGLATNYNAQGYGNRETVALWVKDPAANVRRLPNVQTDPWGNLVFVFALPGDTLYGPYLITAQGLTTGRITYNTLTFWGGLRNQRSSDPISRAVPVYHLQGGGFQPGETVLVDLTWPDASSHHSGPVTANEAGAVEQPLTVEPGWPLGLYAVRATGAVSGHVLLGHFAWDGEVKPLP